MNIPMPEENEKRAAVAAILKEGWRPRRMLPELWRMLRRMGLRYVFYGAQDVLFLAACGVLAVFLLLREQGDVAYAALFAGAPLCYMLFCGIAAWKERQIGVMQWKMACTYDLRQLTACRMLLLGGLGAALEALLGLFLSAGTGGEVEVLRAVGVSLCGLFAYGWAQLLLLRSAKWARNGWLLPCAWIMAQAALLAAVDPRRLNGFFAQVPLAVLGAGVLLLLAAFLWALRGYYFYGSRGGIRFAANR